MYEEMIAYVKEYFEAHDINTAGLPVKLPFRNRFEHIMRVYKWALRICDAVECDREIVAVAAIFHDTGKALEGDRPHAEISADLCDEYLKCIGYPNEKRQAVLEAIRLHSSKTADKASLTIEQKILIDADLLDEVGALAVLWDSMTTALESEPGYYKAYQRHCRFYEKLKRHAVLLKTDYGRLLYEGRLKVLSGFIAELELELGLRP